MIGDNGIDLGHDVRVVFTSWREYEHVGLIEEHLTPQGERCGGGIMFDLPGVAEAFPDRPLWTLCSVDPLTITPSLQCTGCGHHGWIVDGVWCPA